ncbi:hypothetical protein UlMin_003289 [Ulmus minor]
MAEMVVAPVIKVLAQLLIEEANWFKGVHREVKSLKDELESIRCFLKDAEERSEKGNVNDGVKIWVKQVREEAYHIEDVIDVYLLHVAKQTRQHGGLGFLLKTSYLFKGLKRRQDIASEIRNIKASLCEIKERGKRYGFDSVEQESSRGTATSEQDYDPRLGSLFVEDDEFFDVGFTREELMTRLVEGQSPRMVISLVGTGGIGKTTLVKKVYDNEVVKGHFDCCAWITVSQSYNLEKLLRTMMREIHPATEYIAGETGTIIERLISALRIYLETKRYIVVFDDVWQLDFWGFMKHALPNNDRGSRIIVTTRNEAVAISCKDASCGLVEKLQPWPQEMAWEFFCKKSFQHEVHRCCPEELGELSQEIVKKCQGLPLVLATVVGLLSTREKNVFEWRKMHDSLCFELETNPHLSNISKILSLSYNNLPHYLKSCFLYFSVFPEDRLIADVRLYRYWIAEGFVTEKRGKTLEQVAEEYLNELIQRNLVQVWGLLTGGLDKLCRVHDLFHDIIISRANELGFCQILDEKSSKISGKARRLSIQGTEKVVETVDDYSTRSLLLFNDELPNAFMLTLFQKFKKFKLLKVLDLTGAPLSYLPKEVGNLFHLKFLSIKKTKVKVLPKFIGKLVNLEILDFLFTPISELPVEINKLRNLRGLFGFYNNLEAGFGPTKGIQNAVYGIRTPKGFGCLENLHMLGVVNGYHRGAASFKELENLRQLRWLGLATSDLTTENGRALCVAIEKMNHLERLYLRSINKDVILDLEALSSPPRFLSHLDLIGRLQKLPDWVSKLQSLSTITLNDSRLADDPLKYLKNLPSLAYLWLSIAYEGEQLHFEQGGFQKLKLLQLELLDGLKEMKISRGALPLLEELSISSCSQLKMTASNLRGLKSLILVEISEMPREFELDMQPEGDQDHWKIRNVPFTPLRFRGHGDIYDYYESTLKWNVDRYRHLYML